MLEVSGGIASSGYTSGYTNHHRRLCSHFARAMVCTRRVERRCRAPTKAGSRGAGVLAWRRGVPENARGSHLQPTLSGFANTEDFEFDQAPGTIGRHRLRSRSINDFRATPWSVMGRGTTRGDAAESGGDCCSTGALRRAIRRFYRASVLLNEIQYVAASRRYLRTVRKPTGPLITAAGWYKPLSQRC